MPRLTGPEIAGWTLTNSRAYSEGVHYVLVNGAFALDDQLPTYTLAGTTIRNQDVWRREEGPQPPRGRRRPRRVLTSMAPARWPVPHRVVASEADRRDIVSTASVETRRSTSRSPLRTPSRYTSGSGAGSDMVAFPRFQSQLGRRDWTAW